MNPPPPPAAGVQSPVEKEPTTSDRNARRRRPIEWSDLPPDVLRLISLNLTSIWDYGHFRRVCTSWCSAAAIPSDAPPTHQLPSLLLPYDLRTTARSFFDPSDRRVRTVDLPASRGKWLYGTPHGWLVMLGAAEEGGERITVSLLNPITKALILLPPLPRKITVLPEQQGGRYSTRPILTADPTSPDVLLALMADSRLAFCRRGGGKWTVIDLGVPSIPRRRIMVDFTYFDGAFYAVDISKGVTVLNPISLKMHYSAPPSSTRIPFYSTLHLVESSGDLLLLENCNIGLESFKQIEVSKLDWSTRELTWVRVRESIGDRALFVSQKHSSMSLSSRDLFGFRGDLIYFAGDDSKMDETFGNTRVEVVYFSVILDGWSIGRQPYYWQSSGRPRTISDDLIGLTWIIPSLL